MGLGGGRYDLSRGNSLARGVVRTRMCFSAQLQQLLYVLGRPQNFIPHLLQRRSFVIGTHALRWAALSLYALFVMLLLCKMTNK